LIDQYGQEPAKLQPNDAVDLSGPGVDVKVFMPTQVAPLY